MLYKSRYWSDSKLAEFIRKDKIQQTPKPKTFRYWLSSDFLDGVQEIVNYPSKKCRSVLMFLRRAFFYKQHGLFSKSLGLGRWCDLDYRIECCLFDSLVDFVEIELAHFYSICHDDQKIKLSYLQRVTGIWRSKELGLAYLTWAKSLVWDQNEVDKDSEMLNKSTPQAIGAKEIKEIYVWYTEKKAEYQDIEDVDSWIKYCEDNNLNEYKNISKSYEIDAAKYSINTEMLCRLIRVRGHLWT